MITAMGLLAALILLSVNFQRDNAAALPTSPGAKPLTVNLIPEGASTGVLYLPLIANWFEATPLAGPYRVNIPFFTGDIPFTETAIFWFGKVNATENYVDVRLGYTSQELYVRVAVFDRRLWHDTSPTPGDLTSWDAVSLYLNLNGNTGSNPGQNAFQFVGQMYPYEHRLDYQTAYRGSGSGWTAAPISFTTVSRIWGNAPNTSQDARGWALTYRIPFTSLGLNGPPVDRTIWGLAVAMHDRDDSVGTSIPVKTWPPRMSPERPNTWGQLAFGLPRYTPPPVAPSGTTTIRHQLNGASVVDGTVGGGSTCGRGLDYWSEWGEKNYAYTSQVNIQNQFDVSDWPCYSKVYISFPLNSVPGSAEVISATLTLHQFGNAGGGNYGAAFKSLIQVFTIARNWDESTLNWNNAPLAVENVSRAWVEPITSPSDPNGTARTWDLSKAVSEAHRGSRPLEIALYSADGDYNSGKYFYSSEEGDWNVAGRPTLTVVWGYR